MAKATGAGPAGTQPETPTAARAEVVPPAPTAGFRLRAWREFQRALDPLAQPKPLRLPRH